ncbi:LLM class flavin-dependent oxidoreductase [Paraburkholderia sp. BCC1886]|uniref:LLM class flavin-dependent oxidoreductase n=1 Tax=Paraburkholderia sp. BCC1886 TaxID=2562670 RepID=UPI001642C406|nr:LLM class flavin-dependent oxidoreductase [Paraburkholderia sp. BCC1886]
MPANLRPPASRHLEVPGGVRATFALLSDIAVSADRAGWSSLILPAGAHSFDALTVLSALASRTGRIGLVAGIDPAVIPPYTAARRLAALDHISGGRAGWRLTAAVSEAQRSEYVHVLRALWNSWADGAHQIDRDRGVYIDTTAIRPIAHRGPFYSVMGPLDIPRPVQGHPVYFGAKGDDADVLMDDTVVTLPTDMGRWLDMAVDSHTAPEVGEPAISATRTLRAALNLPPASTTSNASHA